MDFLTGILAATIAVMAICVRSLWPWMDFEFPSFDRFISALVLIVVSHLLVYSAGWFRGQETQNRKIRREKAEQERRRVDSKRIPPSPKGD